MDQWKKRGDSGWGLPWCHMSTVLYPRCCCSCWQSSPWLMQVMWLDGDSPHDRCSHRWNICVWIGNKRRSDRSHSWTGGTVPSPTARWDGCSWRCPLLLWPSSAVVSSVAHSPTTWQCPGVGRRSPRESLVWPAIVCTLHQRGVQTSLCSMPPALPQFRWTRGMPSHQNWSCFHRSSAPWFCYLQWSTLLGTPCPLLVWGLAWASPHPSMQPLPRQRGTTTCSWQSGGTHLQCTVVPVPLLPWW